MDLRTNRARYTAKAAQPGGLQLTLANLIIHLETILRIFVRPILLTGFFIAMAWLGVFTIMYPWAHVIALTLFVMTFFESLSRAHLSWKRPSPSLAKRRVEDASGLTHRPLDVIEDRPFTHEADQLALWQVHAARATDQVRHLRWPKWKMNFAEHDPYGLRYAMLGLLAIGFLTGWGMWGGRMIAAINPTLGKLHITSPALDAWITPPAYTHLPPIMIATPAGTRYKSDVINVPEGSVISAHLAEKDGTAPILNINDDSMEFVAEDQKDFEATGTITAGREISIHRGWQTLGSWHIHVVPDQAPQIAFSDQPSVTERKSIRIPFEATDDYGVTSVSLRVTPRESLPGVSAEPIDVPLAAPQAKEVKRASFEDLTPHPWAGLPVTLQLVATDGSGHQAVSDVVNFTLPERVFMHPVARALIEERKKLLQNPFDDSIRNEAANIMAGVAHQPASYRGDPVVLMALRSGAVRLVLDHGTDATASVDDILWQTAVRIEDGAISTAEQNMRQAQKDLADALDRNASEKEIQAIIDRLHQALAQYLSEISSRMAAQPGPVQDLSQLMGPQTNMLTPDDLDRMLNQMRSLSAGGSRDAAREELSRLQQLLENLRTGPVQLSPEQRQALQQLKDMRELVRDQQKLADKTFQNGQDNSGNGRKADHGLAAEQNDLLNRLRRIMESAKGDDTTNMEHGSDAMKRAGSDLQSGNDRTAVEHQNEAVKALQESEQAMQDSLRQGLFMVPRPGMQNAGNDPFGRDFGMFHDDNSVKIPDQMEVRHVREILDELQRRAGDMTRPKTERDYIDRLLQNF